jgi:hypothetical protein
MVPPSLRTGPLPQSNFETRPESPADWSPQTLAATLTAVLPVSAVSGVVLVGVAAGVRLAPLAVLPVVVDGVVLGATVVVGVETVLVGVVDGFVLGVETVLVGTVEVAVDGVVLVDDVVVDVLLWWAPHPASRTMRRMMTTMTSTAATIHAANRRTIARKAAISGSFHSEDGFRRLMLQRTPRRELCSTSQG